MKKIIIPFLILLIIILVIFFIFGIKRKVIINNIKHLRLSYSNGYAMYAYSIYEINYEDGKYILSIKPNGVPDEEVQKEEISKKDIKQVINILNKYNVSKWDGFNKIDKNVLDGDSFSFSLKYNDDKDVSASGYMRYPKDYGLVKQELVDIFTKYYKDEGVIYE